MCVGRRCVGGHGVAGAQCFLTCFEAVLKFISRQVRARPRDAGARVPIAESTQAYVHTALRGYGFCSASKVCVRLAAAACGVNARALALRVHVGICSRRRKGSSSSRAIWGALLWSLWCDAASLQWLLRARHDSLDRRQIGDFFLMLGKLVVTAATGVSAYYITKARAGETWVIE